MQKFSVTGMSCAACAARIEKAVGKIAGVSECAVNLLTNSLSVEGSALEDEIIFAVKKAGYGAQVKSGFEKKFSAKNFASENFADNSAEKNSADNSAKKSANNSAEKNSASENPTAKKFASANSASENSADNSAKKSASNSAEKNSANNSAKKFPSENSTAKNSAENSSASNSVEKKSADKNSTAKKSASANSASENSASNSAEKNSKSEVSQNAAAELAALERGEVPALKKRFFSSLLFLILLVYLSMGHAMLNFPIPHFLENPAALGVAELLLCVCVMVLNQKFFVSGFSSLICASPNMDTLVALGSAASFCYSTAVIFKITAEKNPIHAFALTHDFYFEGAAMILVLITLGKILEERSKGKTTNALKNLLRLSPKTAIVIRENKEVTILTEDVLEGDIFCVRPGQNIPVDGVIIEGSTSINEAAITGESVPKEKTAGDGVTSATLNLTGFIKCRATRVGSETTLFQIIKLVSEASATKAPVQKIADKVSSVFVPFVLVIAIVTTFAWIFLGSDFGFALSRGVSVLVVSCPCALGLATPVAIMVSSGVGAKNGILFKTAAALEKTGKTKIAAFDKTGTITKGVMQVTDIFPNKISESEFLKIAASVESKSFHPIAKAILLKAESEKISLEEASDFFEIAGGGIKAKIGEKEIFSGNEKFIQKKFFLKKEILQKVLELCEQGKTPVLFASENQFFGIVALADQIKDDCEKAILELQKMGIACVMITGDNERAARKVAKKAGVKIFFSEVLPAKKAEIVNALKKCGPVAMIGDGINDAVALTAADTGIAIGAGTDVAIDAADVVLVKNRLSDVAAAIRLSRAALSNIRENLFWAFFYNAALIPLAAGMWIWLFTWKLNPMFCAAAMSLSSFCVVTNALRLNFFDMRKSKKKFGKKKFQQVSDLIEKIDLAKFCDLENSSLKNSDFENSNCADFDFANSEKTNLADLKNSTLANENAINSTFTKTEEKVMKKTLKIEGMMCQNCERHTKEALEKVSGVVSAAANCKTGEAVVELSCDVSDVALAAAVEEAGYKVV